MPPPSDLALDREDAVARLLSLSEAMAGEGRTLIERVLPAPPETYRQWTHYPPGDAIDPVSGARFYYHAHPPEQRGEREHGHFHLFLPLATFGEAAPLACPAKEDTAKVVHVAALCFDVDGLPTEWIATNQWVTQEYLFPAEHVIARLGQMQLDDAGADQGMAQVGAWLTAAIATCREDLAALLRARDAALKETTTEDRSAEILARTPFAL